MDLSEKIKQSELSLKHEFSRWEKLGVNPFEIYQSNVGMLGLIVRFRVLEKLLTEKGIFSEEEGQHAYNEILVEELRHIYKDVEKAIKQQKLEALRNGTLGKRLQ